VKLKVWIAAAGVTTLVVTADVTTANIIYDSTRTGMRVVAEIQDVSTDGSAVSKIGTFCSAVASGGGPVVFETDPTVLNVYYVEKVVNPTNATDLRGQWCDPAVHPDQVIYISNDKYSSTTLAHELGHALLADASHPTWDLLLNVMSAGGGGLTDAQAAGRKLLTLGQVFRMDFFVNAWVNAAGIRTGPTRDCAVLTPQEQCPPQKFNP